MFFNGLFVNKMPRELRIMLCKATHNSKLAHIVVAAVAVVSLQEPEGEDTTVQRSTSPWSRLLHMLKKVTVS